MTERGSLDTVLSAPEEIEAIAGKTVDVPERLSWDSPAKRVITVYIPLALFLLGIGGGTYWMLGQPYLAWRSAQGTDTRDVNGLIGLLIKRVRIAPDDLQAWVYLGRGYMGVGDAGDAAKAYARAVTLANKSGHPDAGLDTLYGEALVAQAAQGCVIEHPTPDTGDLDEDLLFLFNRYHSAEDEQRLPDLLPMLIDAALRDPALQEVVDELLEQRRRPMRTVLQLAQLRGEISRDLDLDTAIALIVGPLTYRRLVERRDVSPEFKETMVRSATAGLRAMNRDAATAR